MSQQINLLLPELRPRFDWLGFPFVSSVALIGLLLVAVAYGYLGARLDALRQREASVRNELVGVQEQVKSIGQAIAARRGNAGLEQRIVDLRQGIADRQAVLAAVAQGGEVARPGYAGVLRAFSRLSMPGVWLVGFGLSGAEVELKGRLIDPALLPRYIGRLNDEPDFAGRRFAALDMKGIDADAEATSKGGSDAGKQEAARHFVEFSLRSETGKQP